MHENILKDILSHIDLPKLDFNTVDKIVQSLELADDYKNSVDVQIENREKKFLFEKQKRELKKNITKLVLFNLSVLSILLVKAFFLNNEVTLFTMILTLLTSIIAFTVYFLLIIEVPESSSTKQYMFLRFAELSDLTWKKKIIDFFWEEQDYKPELLKIT